MDINWSGLAPTWPMILAFASGFIYLVRLGIDQKNADRRQDAFEETTVNRFQELDKEIHERFLTSSKEVASWLQNLDESKIKPVERDIVRVEKETAKLGVMISDEYKALRQQHSETHKELVDMKILVAKMSEQMTYLLKGK